MSEMEVGNKFRQVHAEYKQAKDEMQSLHELQQQLRLSYQQRRKRYFEFRDQISLRANNHFVFLLSRRGFRGKLTFDHQKEVIALKVHPPGEAKNASRKDAKSLSGGEKSFAQVCLLLAVWEAMASPIRVLDELSGRGRNN
jgi:structural maintenance of chromosomes protein 6